MKKPAALLAFGALTLAGCAMFRRPPADVAYLELTTEDSPVVRVTKIWLERKKGPLVVSGYVVKQIEVKDTTNTHIDVTLFDRDGQVLRRTIEHFEPRQIPRRWRMPDYASYRVVLDPLPPGTAGIEVRAHEGEHDRL